MTYQEATEEILQIEEEIRLLEHKLPQLERELREKKEQAQECRNQLYREKLDVERLEKVTLTKLLSKISGSYEEKYKKEYQEYVLAKNRLDTCDYQVEECQGVVQRCRNEIGRLQQQRKEKGRRLREDYPEGQKLADDEEACKRKLLAQRKELTEAERAAAEVYAIAEKAREQFLLAKSWATWDIVGGGLTSGVVKYDAIDEGASIIYQMNVAASRFAKELRDVDLVFEGTFEQIGGATRLLDIAFDNIFTDWKVREKIKQNLEQLEEYSGQLRTVMETLEQKRKNVEAELEALNQRA